MAFHVIEPRTPQWHLMRARHIGASEVSALLDAEAPYALSRFALWQVKAGRAEPPEVDSDRIRAGMALEPAIGSMAAALHGWTLRPGRYATDDTTPGMGASLDFEAEGPGDLPGLEGPGVVECKNVDWMVHRRTWTGDQPPVHQLLQLQHQLACTGYGWGVLVALIGGNDLRVRVYRPRPRIIETIRQRVRGFWQSIEQNKTPSADGSEGASAVIRSMFPEVVFEPLDLTDSNTLPVLCSEYLDAVQDEREAKKRKDELRNQIMAEIGPHEAVTTQGFRISQAVTKAKPAREAVAGEIIPSRAETRRLSIKERINA